MLRKFHLDLLMLVVFALVASSAAAQPSRPTRPPRGTPEAPSINPPTGSLSGTPALPGLGGERPTRGENSFTLPDSLTMPEMTLTVPEEWQSYQMPEEWSEFTLPEGFPTDPTDLESFLQGFELPYDLSFDGLPVESSTDAVAAIVAFASQYLGTVVTPIYAGSFSAQGGASDSTYTSIASTLPTEYQAMLDAAASLSGVGYWAMLDNGVAVIYTGECPADASCTYSIDMLQFTITDGSLGVYSVYFQGNVTSQEQALQAAYAAYPSLAGMQLTVVPVENGYAFSSVAGSVQAQQLTAYAVSVVSASGQTVVTAGVGVGNAYVEIVR